MNQKSTLKIRDTSKRKRLGMIMRLHRLALLKLMGEEVDTEPADPQKQFGGKKAASRFWWVRMSCNIKHPWAAFDPRIETSYGNSLGRYATEEEAAEAVRDALGFESINDLLREKHPESVTLLKSAPNKKREKNHD